MQRPFQVSLYYGTLGTWCVTGWLALAVPRMVLTQDCLDSPETVTPGKRIELHSRDWCVQTLKEGYRTLRLTCLHRTHITNLSDLKKEKEKIKGGNDTLCSGSTRPGSPQKNLWIVKLLLKLCLKTSRL